MASHDAYSEREELELKVKFAGAAEGTEIKQTYSHYYERFFMIITCRHQTKSILSEAVFLPGFRTLGTTVRTHREGKGGS